MTEDEDAWWPPILEPSRFGRIWFAWWIMLVASQSTRRWIDSRAASSSAATMLVRPGSIVSIVASASVSPALDYTWRWPREDLTPPAQVDLTPDPSPARRGESA